jgi:hypothetical protein
MVPDQPSEDQALRLAADFLDSFEARSQTLNHSVYVLARSAGGDSGYRFAVDRVSSKTQRSIWGEWK